MGTQICIRFLPLAIDLKPLTAGLAEVLDFTSTDSPSDRFYARTSRAPVCFFISYQHTSLSKNEHLVCYDRLKFNKK